MNSISRLRRLPVREVWADEARDFTPWLLANADVLSEVLGVDVELRAAEHRVGNFSLDLIGSTIDGATVIVENQLEKTNHNHLGQLLTYAGGTEPKVVVWCAPEFQDEHRAALEWLNAHTDEETQFFGIEVGAVRIGDSDPAPDLRLVVQPNRWARQVKAAEALSDGLEPRHIARRELWTLTNQRLHALHPSWVRLGTTSKEYGYGLPFGAAGMAYQFVLSRKKYLRLELYFQRAEEMRSWQEFVPEIEAAVGQPVRSEITDGGKGKQGRIYIDRPAIDLNDKSTWDEGIDWLIATFEKFRPITQDIRQRLL